MSPRTSTSMGCVPFSIPDTHDALCGKQDISGFSRRKVLLVGANNRNDVKKVTFVAQRNVPRERSLAPKVASKSLSDPIGAK